MISGREPVELSVYELSGRRVRRLVVGRVRAGTHRVAWDGRNDAGSRVPSCVYLYHLTLGRLLMLAGSLRLASVIWHLRSAPKRGWLPRDRRRKASAGYRESGSQLASWP
ncbi:MAG: hypothetical protein CME06_12215, partial [Gemmatimonadetes bacterium]|nr:hypothetical protein [Gemmatimonadota bacterium]